MTVIGIRFTLLRVKTALYISDRLHLVMQVMQYISSEMPKLRWLTHGMWESSLLLSQYSTFCVRFFIWELANDLQPLFQ